MSYSSGGPNHYIGEAAVHATIAQLIMRGYNPARPLFDHGPSDDFYLSYQGGSRIWRFQVKSISFVWNQKKDSSTSVKLPVPACVLEKDTGLDYVSAVFWDGLVWWLALFPPSDLRKLHKQNGIGSLGKVRGNASSGTLTFRFGFERRANPIVTLNRGKIDVTKHFHHFTNGLWDTQFPHKIKMQKIEVKNP